MRRAAAACLLMLLGVSAPARAEGLDHVVLGISDLSSGIEEFRTLTGVEPALGGEHPGAGTHNALASLGRGTYVEIISPVPGAPPGLMSGRLAALERLTPVMWAIAVEDVGAVGEWLGADGHAIFGPARGSRVLPDGGVLDWQIVMLPFSTGYPPFFIQWGEGSPHPSTTAPGGCSLASIAVTDPEPGGFAKILDRFELPVEVRSGEASAMRLALECPNGRVEFDSAG